MEKNKIIALIDISSFDNHFTETMVLANILDKQCDHLTLLDLNNVGDNKYIDKTIKSKKEADLSSFKLFDRSLYQILANSSEKQNKALNLVDQAVNKNQKMIICLSQKENSINSKILTKVEKLIVFADIKTNATNKLLKFFVNNKIKDKQISLVVYNYVSNSINNEKELISIRKMVKGFDISIDTIDKINDFESLKDIAHIDPWDNLYKIIKKII